MRVRRLPSVLGVLLLLLAGTSYLVLVVARIDPFTRPMRVTVNLAESGGLLDRSEVTFRGFPVGAVTAIRTRPDGVRVDLELDEGTRIPADTDVAVANLSFAGEQYLDFRPRTDDGPFVADGTVVDQSRTATPVPFTQVLTTLSRLAGQVDPATLGTVVRELDAAVGGSGPDLQRILDGGQFLLAGLEQRLPETVRLLRNGRVVLGTVAELRPQLDRFAGSARTLTQDLRDADPEIRRLLEVAPGSLDAVDRLIRENQPTLAALLGDLATVSEVVAARTASLGVFFPELATLGDRGALIVRDGRIQVLADAYPRPTCSYGTPQRSPAIGGSPPPRLHRYCLQDGPRLQQRGALNAPRPRGDDTAGPRPGVTGDERARPPERTVPR